MKARAAVVCAAALALGGCAAARRGAPRSVVVTVEGSAPMGAGGWQDARRRALADAQRRALEEGAGVRVNALSVLDGGLVAVSRLSATANGTLDDVRVLKERRGAGAVTVRIRARVTDLGNAPAEDGWPAGNGPRLYVVGTNETKEARDALLREWTRRGGSVAAWSGEADIAARAFVEAAAQEEPRVRPFVSWRVRLRLSSMGDPREPWEVDRSGAALGLDPGDARSRALDEAGRAAAAALAALPPAAWRAAHGR